jgi:hypothetical protein
MERVGAEVLGRLFESGETPDVCERCIACTRNPREIDSGEVAEIVEPHEIDEPFWRPRLSSLNAITVPPLPFIQSGGVRFGRGGVQVAGLAWGSRSPGWSAPPMQRVCCTMEMMLARPCR